MGQYYFRVDHGTFIGDGHLYRCKALAEALVHRGHKVIFITRPHKGFTPSKFSPFELVCLSELPETPAYQNGYQNWLGMEQLQDASECLLKTSRFNDETWIVDHYGIDVQWETRLKAENKKVVVIDDLFREHSADLIIDQNLTADEKIYMQKNRVSSATFCMGPHFALLRKEMAQAAAYDSTTPKKTILLYLGTLPEDVFYKLLGVIREFKLEHLEILNPPANFQLRENESTLSFSNDLIQVYYRQLYVIGSCAVANLERMALGVPTISCVVVDNQQLVGKKIIEGGLQYHLGDIRSSKVEDIRDSFSSFINASREEILLSAERAKKIVSMNGLENILKALL